MGEVITEQRDGVLTVTLHRPGRLNALSLSLQREQAELWARVRRDALGLTIVEPRCKALISTWLQGGKLRT